MLHELVQAQLKLLPYLSNEYFKKKLATLGLTCDPNKEEYTYRITHHAISNSIYGLDIDAGAIDITRLRLWLAVAGNERSLTPPDFNIMKGNALVDLPEDWKNIYCA